MYIYFFFSSTLLFIFFVIGSRDNLTFSVRVYLSLSFLV